MPWFEGEKYPEYGLESRGKYATFSSALADAARELEREWTRHPFEATVERNFKRLFPGMPAWPGKYDPETGYYDIMVANSASMFFLRPKLGKIQAALKSLPGCPKNLKAVLQIYIRR